MKVLITGGMGVIGTLLLFFMRGFDVWIEAAKTEGVSPLSRVMTLEPWLELSWFLIVPLALNVAVLCPIVLLRAMKAKKASSGASIAIASALGVLTLIYLVLVFTHKAA